MTKKSCLLLLQLIFLLTTFSLKAQEDCAFTLSRAQRLFDAGNIEQIPQMLKPCIENGFTTEERQQALKLIILSYLFDKNEVEAEKAMLDFLKKYPEYELNPSDQAEFVQLFNSYVTLPIVSAGITGGANFSSINTGDIFQPSSNPGKYSSKSGFQGGLSLRFYLIDKLDLNIEGFYQQTVLNFYNNGIAAKTILDFDETRTALSIPVSVIYTPFHFNKINPFLRLGSSFEYLISSTAKGSSTNDYFSKSTLISDIDLMDNRKKYQIQVLGGFGLTYKLKRSYILLEVRYNKGFFGQTLMKTGMNSPNSDFWSIYNIEENDYQLSHLSINAGLLYKFYKPRKKQ